MHRGGSIIPKKKRNQKKEEKKERNDLKAKVSGINHALAGSLNVAFE